MYSQLLVVAQDPHLTQLACSFFEDKFETFLKKNLGKSNAFIDHI